MFIVLFARWGIFLCNLFFLCHFFSVCSCAHVHLSFCEVEYFLGGFLSFFFFVFLCSYSQFYLPELGPFCICQVMALLYEGMCPFNICFLLVEFF